jgi:hypothetical protein
VTDLHFSHTTRLGAVVRQIESAPDEMSRWQIQKALLDWLKEKAHIGNREPKRPVELLP